MHADAEPAQPRDDARRLLLDLVERFDREVALREEDQYRQEHEDPSLHDRHEAADDAEDDEDDAEGNAEGEHHGWGKFSGLMSASSQQRHRKNEEDGQDGRREKDDLDGGYTA